MNELHDVLRPFRDAAAVALLDDDLTDRAMGELRGFVEDAQLARLEGEFADARVAPLWRRGLTAALEYEAQRSVEMGLSTADAWLAWTGDELTDERYALSQYLGLHSA